jgi:site-specific DNA recombinase
VSTAEQAENGTSLDLQAELINAHIDGLGWVYAGDYVDAGVSGTSADRPAWKRLLADAQAGMFDVVVVAKLDRFSRGVVHARQAIDGLQEAGVDIVSLAEKLDLTTYEGRGFFGMMSVFAEMEVERIRDRAAAGQRKRASLGRVPGGGMPYGWRRAGSGGYEHHPEEAETLRVVAGHILDEQGTTGTAAALLNALGRRRRSGAEWTHQRVLSTLDSRASLLGELTWGKPGIRGQSDGEARRRSTKVDAKGRPVYGDPTTVRLGDPIIDPHTFDRLHEILALRRYGQRSDAAPYPLTGMLSCAWAPQ